MIFIKNKKELEKEKQKRLCLLESYNIDVESFGYYTIFFTTDYLIKNFSFFQKILFWFGFLKLIPLLNPKLCITQNFNKYSKLRQHLNVYCENGSFLQDIWIHDTDLDPDKPIHYIKHKYSLI